jgi:hypothetical protein
MNDSIGATAPKQDEALRYNEGKLQWGLVHFKSIEPMVKVLEFGAKKYAPDNWKKPMDKRKILESMQRHLAAMLDGEAYDSESGQLHIGHIQCNAMFWNYHYNNLATESNLGNNATKP